VSALRAGVDLSGPESVLETGFGSAST